VRSGRTGVLPPQESEGKDIESNAYQNLTVKMKTGQLFRVANRDLMIILGCVLV